MATCVKCGAELEEDAIFCNQCGQKVERATFGGGSGAAAAGGASAGIGKTNQRNERETSAVRRRPRIELIVAAALLVCAAAVFMFVFSRDGDGGQLAALYLKDNEISYTLLKNGKPAEITERLSTDEVFDDVGEILGLGIFTLLSEDGSRIFYPDRHTGYLDSYSGVNLYVRNLKGKNQDAVKIDSDVRLYCAPVSSDKVFYIKSDDGVLYEHDLGDKTKIDSDVALFYVDDAGTKLLYVNSEGELYSRFGGGDKVRIDSGISSLLKVSDDLSAVWYEKNESLYLKKNNEDKIKIIADNTGVDLNSFKIYYTGEIYYVRYEDGSPALLYYYNGKDSVLMDKLNFPAFGTSFTTYDDNTPFVIYASWNENGDSEIHAAAGSVSMKVVSMEDLEDLFADYYNFAGIWINKDITAVYFLLEKQESGYDLYVLPMNGGIAGKMELYDSDVSEFFTFGGDGNSPVYFKDVRNNMGDLYVDKVRADFDVYVSSVMSAKNTKTLVYSTDWDGSRQYGTLKIYDGTAKKIADDAHIFFPINDKCVLYLLDYDTDRGRGDLYFYDGDKGSKLDEDVTGLIPGNIAWIMQQMYAYEMNYRTSESYKTIGRLMDKGFRGAGL
ncbi:MAG: zinc ribbon domain-containing protein, partial [Peptococcaceae bacterium]|nr:zinc ribbon domain-containing protein [Peptococcaceae bacterium]